ncbi:hypothetical protein ACHAWX_006059 [Stephanocyclus meneghinianus]
MSEHLHVCSAIASMKESDSGSSTEPTSAAGANIYASHRVSMISSISSGSIANPLNLPPSSASLKRTVSSMSSVESSSTQLEYSREFKHHKPDPERGHTRITRLHNARILQTDGSLLRGSITLDPESGLIVELSLDHHEAGEEKHEEALSQLFDCANRYVDVLDCKGQIISPGFIDIQLNGAYGVDFSNARGLNADDILLVAQRLLASGVTSFCPTMVSSSRETYRRVIPLIRKAREEQSNRRRQMHETMSANILGMQLEGPFFALSKRGAHDSKHIVAPSKGMASVREAYGLDSSSDDTDDRHHLKDIAIITMAPELEGASEAIRSLTKLKDCDDQHSIVVSCGHTEASYEDGINAVSDGATLLTHLYNAMNPFHHRQPGLVGLLSSELKLARLGLERPYYSMIVDGIHVHESAVCMAYNSHPRGEYRSSWLVFVLHLKLPITSIISTI